MSILAKKLARIILIIELGKRMKKWLSCIFKRCMMAIFGKLETTAHGLPV